MFKNLPTCSDKYKIFITCMLGFVNMSIMQSNLGIAIVDPQFEEERRLTGDKQIHHDLKVEFHENNLLLSAFLYGNLFAPIGGLLVRILHPFWLYNASIMFMAVLTILTPIIIHYHLFLFVLCRITMGAFQALARTSLIQTASSWKTLKDAVLFVGLIAVGNNFGIAISYPFIIFLIENVGWDRSFYTTGALSLLVVISGALLMPMKDLHKHSNLSGTVEVSLQTNYKKYRKSNAYVTILSSKSVHALNYIKFILAGGMASSMYYGPQFIKDISEGSSLRLIGALSSILNVGPLIAYPISAILLTYLLDVQKNSINKAHSINFYFGSTLAVVFLLSCAICTNAPYRICFLALFQTFVCFADLTTQIVPLYLTPKYAGFLSSLGTMSRTIGSILLPLVWKCIGSSADADKWKLIFTFIASLTALTIPLFALISFEPLPSTSIENVETSFRTIGAIKIHSLKNNNPENNPR